MPENRTKLWYLKNLDIFSHLREEEYKMIDRYVSMREVKKGEVLYFEGSEDKNFYLLKKGAVKMIKHTPQGKEFILDIIKGGSIFGEMTMVDPQEKDESAEVIEDGLICTMTKVNFDQLIGMVPGLSVKLTKIIGFRRRKLENKLLDLLFSTVEQRLAKTLLNLLDDFGIPHNDGYLLKIKLTHQDFSDLIASTRETVTTVLNKFKNEGMIDYEGKYVVIRSLEGLKTIVG
jgi:CRP-like cAMP-binding protein